MPKGLRERLSKLSQPELVQSEIHRYQLEEENRRRADEMTALLTTPFVPGQPNRPLLGPPVSIEILPPKPREP